MGVTTGHTYLAIGSWQQTVYGFVPATSDGNYAITSNFVIADQSSGEKHSIRKVQKYTVSDDGNTLDSRPDEVVCK